MGIMVTKFVVPKLTPLQLAHANTLADRPFGGCDWSEPGTGKTLTALHAVQLRLGGRKPTPASPLVIASKPISLRMWQRVASAVFELGASDVAEAKTGNQDAIRAASIIVASYNMLGRYNGLAAELSARLPCAIIMDEAHNLSNVDTAATKALLGHEETGTFGVAGACEFALGLTGTPMPRYADGVYPMLRIVGEEALNAAGAHSYEAFIETFCNYTFKKFHPRQWNAERVITGSKNLQVLNDLLMKPHALPQPYAVKRVLADMADIAEVPKARFVDLEVQYDKTSALAEAEASVPDDVYYDANTATSATVRRLLGMAKVPHVVDFLKDTKNYYKSPILVFYWHNDVGAALYTALSELPSRVALLNGATPVKQRAEIEDNWNAKKYDFLIGQMAAMGESLCLERGGRIAVVAEHDWARSRHEQAYRRLERIGQDEQVIVYNLYADHPADDAALKVATRKAEYAYKATNTNGG